MNFKVAAESREGPLHNTSQIFVFAQHYPNETEALDNFVNESSTKQTLEMGKYI